MKNYIFSALIALSWAMPLMGITVRNITENNTFLTATLPEQKISTTVTMQPHGQEIIELTQSVPRMDITVGSIIPARQQMTAIEPLKGSRGWLFTGRNAQGHALYAPLTPRTEKEIPLQGARVSYAAIDGQITRIDSFPEERNSTDQESYTLQPASYAKDIDPKSYIMVMRDKKSIARLYAPLVARSAAAQWYKNKK